MLDLCLIEPWSIISFILGSDQLVVLHFSLIGLDQLVALHLDLIGPWSIKHKCYTRALLSNKQSLVLYLDLIGPGSIITFILGSYCAWSISSVLLGPWLMLIAFLASIPSDVNSIKWKFKYRIHRGSHNMWQNSNSLTMAFKNSNYNLIKMWKYK